MDWLTEMMSQDTQVMQMDKSSGSRSSAGRLGTIKIEHSSSFFLSDQPCDWNHHKCNNAET